ncbi:hypothetical protein Zm00014a_043334 [Zea mays]|uniref:Uncharacterized protein n=2 Tax=Zea mays TaxID=4577 RepID=A0A8J8XWR8_MAIZE|nr:hypothetical protein ZEAMMB73_Zm00001d047011 [Zea mays]PWZ05420.1 hypothetical protein Zm00014a_043334 [Zea mays]
MAARTSVVVLCFVVASALLVASSFAARTPTFESRRETRETVAGRTVRNMPVIIHHPEIPSNSRAAVPVKVTVGVDPVTAHLHPQHPQPYVPSPP